MRVWNPFARAEAPKSEETPGSGRLSPGNAQHVGSRDDQEDSFGFSDPEDRDFVRHGGFAAVLADGMGGLARGQDASAAAVRAFLAAYSAKTPEESIAAAMERSARLANDAVAALAEGAGMEGNIGTTLVAAVVRPGALEWISVGDSALYLYRRGELRLLSHAHTYAVELDASASRGAITAEQARVDPDRDALTSYIGAPEIASIDRSAAPLPLESGDRILLCSDGLFKTLAPAELAAELEAAPQEACEALVRKTLERGAPDQDNVTVLCVKVEGAEEARTTRGAHRS
jgi:protein phosphatase